MAVLPKCPICKRPVERRSKNPSFPFCSPRCRAVDLGRWLGEEYRLPDQTPEEQEDELPAEGRSGEDRDA